MQTEARRFDAKDYVRIFTKRKWFIIIVAVASTIIGGLYAISYPKTYKGQSIVIIRRQEQPLIWIDDLTGRTGQGPRPASLTLDAQATIASSIGCAERASEALATRSSGLSINVPPSEIRESIQATPRAPDRLIIESTHAQERYAIEFANEVARAFTDINRELRRAETRSAIEFLEEALKRADTAMQEAQAEIAAYQEATGILTADEPLRMAQLIEEYRRNSLAVDVELQEARATLDALRQQVQTNPIFRTHEIETKNPVKQNLEQQLERERLELSRLRSRYTDNWPEVREAQRRIEELEARYVQEPEIITTPHVEMDGNNQELRANLLAAERRVESIEARRRELLAKVDSIHSSATDLPLKAARLQQHLDRVAMAKGSYQNVLAQLENARLNEAMKQGDAEVIDRAVTADEVSPRLLRMLIFSFVLGLFCGIALAMLLEALDDTIHSPDDIAAYTDVNFLGIVPLLEDPERRIITLSSPKSPPAEAYRSLRSNIQFAQIDSPSRQFLITSAGAGEGKSMTAANLAVVFAQAGQNVLIVDTDLRRPSMHKLFGESAERGLTNVLVGEADLEEVIKDTEVPGLQLIPTGPLPPNPAELLESDAMNRVIERTRELADVVIYDSPPAIILTDAVILSSKIEQTILVAEAGQVSREAFNEMQRLIINARGNILGVVLNKLRLTASDYYYYYYYYDYAHYSSRSGPDGRSVRPEHKDGNGFIKTEAPDALEEIFGEDEVREKKTDTSPKRPEQPKEDELPPTDAENLISTEETAEKTDTSAEDEPQQSEWETLDKLFDDDQDDEDKDR